MRVITFGFALTLEPGSEREVTPEAVARLAEPSLRDRLSSPAGVTQFKFIVGAHTLSGDPTVFFTVDVAAPDWITTDSLRASCRDIIEDVYEDHAAVRGVSVFATEVDSEQQPPRLRLV